MAETVIRVAALADLHCTKTSQGAFQPLFARITESADLLLLAGDLTDYGLPEEARVLAKELTALRIPVAAVLGNHDVESGKADEVTKILAEAGLHVLDGDACELLGIGIAGVKGFGGGFGKRALGPWGETIIKQFVREAVDEALKLEAALARLRTPQLVALLHYSPVQQTVEGEPLEIYPFPDRAASRPLGSCLVFPARAPGQPARAPENGAPVYNVSMPLLTRTFADRPPFRVFDVRVDAQASVSVATAATRGRRATDAVAS
jgi:Icc-related predicted phosphoesterase